MFLSTKSNWIALKSATQLTFYIFVLLNLPHFLMSYFRSVDFIVKFLDTPILQKSRQPGNCFVCSEKVKLKCC